MKVLRKNTICYQCRSASFLTNNQNLRIITKYAVSRVIEISAQFTISIPNSLLSPRTSFLTRDCIEY